MFVNTQYFREAAIHMQKHGRYADGDPYTPEWELYWDREHDRVENGYSVGGVPITGTHYLYLNYLPIKRITSVKNKDLGIFKTRGLMSKTSAKRQSEFPDFWDEDYVIYHSWDIAKYGITKEKLEIVDKGTRIPIIRSDYNLSGGHHHLWLKPRGVGAPQPVDEIVITQEGDKRIGDIKVGDYVFDRQGKPTMVSELYPQGKLQVFEVELMDGRKVTCGENHLWTIVTRVRNGVEEFKDLTTKQLIDNKLYYETAQGQKSYKYKIPKIEPVEFDTKIQIIPPYVVGALLGDGSISGKNIKIATDDKEIVEEFRRLLPEFKVNRDFSNNNYLISLIDEHDKEYKELYPEYNKCGKVNPLKRELEALEINVTCKDKFIPNVYKYGDIEQRLSLVKGLMDTDGHVTKQGYCEFTNSSKQLIDDLAYVLRSLGIYCSIGEDNRTGEKHNIIDRDGRVSEFNRGVIYRLYIATNVNIFNLSRKTKRISTKKFTKSTVPIVSITKLDKYEEQVCLGVDNSEHLYLTRDFIVTHNSWKGASLAVKNQFFGEDNSTFIIADQKQYLLKDGLFDKYLSHVNSLNSYSPDNRHNKFVSGFARKFSLKGVKDMEYKASYYAQDAQGNTIEKGRKTSVYGVIMNGDPDNLRGKRGDAIFEEFGSFPLVDKAWEMFQSSVEEDGNVFATMYGFGTGGDTGAGIESLTQMYYDPEAYNLLAFENNFDEHFFEKSCAYFTPAFKNITFKDKDGNSNVEEGKAFYDELRAQKAAASDPSLLPAHKAEKPYSPQEALLNSSGNIFPVTLLQNQLNRLVATKIDREIVNYGRLEKTALGIKFILDSNLIPFEAYPVLAGADKTGALAILHTPFRGDGGVPKNLYRISVDPYRHDGSSGDSIGDIRVMENPNKFTSYKGDKIVAWYSGRPSTQDEFNELLFNLAEYYNAQIAPENDEPGDIIGYAKRFKKLQWLEPEFELAYDSKIATKNPGNRTYGMHISSGKNDLRKKQGDKYIQEWLLRPRGLDESGNVLYNLNTIYDRGLLKELIKYKDGINVDRVSSLRINMFYEKEFEYKNRKPDLNRKQDPYFTRKRYKKHAR